MIDSFVDWDGDISLKPRNEARLAVGERASKIWAEVSWEVGFVLMYVLIQGDDDASERERERGKWKWKWKWIRNSKY
jgi:hypothetical protein